MKIYITGIAGFLGSHLAKRLQSLGHQIGGNDTMILGDKENLPNNIEFHKTDCINYDEMVKNLKGYDQKRIYGFLAERFMPYWFKKNFHTTTCPITFFETDKI